MSAKWITQASWIVTDDGAWEALLPLLTKVDELLVELSQAIDDELISLEDKVEEIRNG